MHVIVTQSLLGQSAMETVIERTFERGLPHMLTCVRRYDEIVDIHKDDFYEEVSRLAGGILEPDRRRSPRPRPELTQSLPQHYSTYDHAASLEAIKGRYERILPPVWLTLPRLSAESRFMDLVAKLREEGWKDWHLLTAVSNIVVNRRAVHRGLNLTTSYTQDDIDKFRAIMGQEEHRDDPETPAESFTEDEMWFHLANAEILTAKQLGLEVRLHRFEPRSLLSVLGDRFNYWDDDFDHEPIL